LRRQKPFRDARRFFVAVEGERTEKWYLDGLQAHGLVDERRVQVLVLEAEEGRSAPKWVLSRLDAAVSAPAARFKRGLDEAWMVLDVDRWPRPELTASARECRERGWSMALSNPCFEVWLILHLEEPEAPAPQGPPGAGSARRRAGPKSTDVKTRWKALHPGAGGADALFDRAVVERAVARGAARLKWVTNRVLPVGATAVHHLVRSLLGG
jgi:hypothetical protein